MLELRAELVCGRTLIGPLVSCPAPAIVELFGWAGHDFVLIDTEQSPTSSSGPDLESMVRAADAAGVAAMVRVADNVESQINNALNLGAQGVWIPHVESAEAAHEIVRACHYAPRGARGAAPIVRAARYGHDSWAAYRARCETRNFAVAIVESVKGLEAVEAIAAVPGLDAICFGPFDMAVDMGLDVEAFYPTARTGAVHPQLDAAAARVLAACRANDVIPATAGWEPGMAKHWLAAGYKLMLYGLDFGMFAKAARTLKAEIDLLQP